MLTVLDAQTEQMVDTWRYAVHNGSGNMSRVAIDGMRNGYGDAFTGALVGGAGVELAYRISDEVSPEFTSDGNGTKSEGAAVLALAIAQSTIQHADAIMADANAEDPDYSLRLSDGQDPVLEVYGSSKGSVGESLSSVFLWASGSGGTGMDTWIKYRIGEETTLPSPSVVSHVQAEITNRLVAVRRLEEAAALEQQAAEQGELSGEHTAD